jgi:hypothetical protein
MQPSSDNQCATFTIEVRAELLADSTTREQPELAAYAFTQDARGLARVDLDGNGHGAIQVHDMRTVTALRVVVGPRLAEKEASFAALMRHGAVERHLRVDPKGELKQRVAVTVLPPVWTCWFLRACFVRGTLMKQVMIGGESVDLPVCHATVEVYEVDRWPLLIAKLPDSILDRLRDIVVGPVRPVPPIPDPGPLAVARAVEALPLPRSGAGRDLEPFARAMVVTPPIAPEVREAEMKAALERVPEAKALRYVAETGNAQQFRQSLIGNAELIRPIFCFYFPGFITKQLIATAETDECGHFQTVFFRGCSDTDQPDLYFKAKQKLFGLFDATIYAPTPVACHTHWNYVCGTEVRLVTQSPWAHTCSPCPPITGPNGEDRWVAFMSIGVHGLNRIHGTSPNLVATTTAANRGLTDGGAPWAGTLLPRLEFANALEAAGVRYYRVSWRRGTSGTFMPLLGTVTHYYRHDVPTATGNLPVWSPFVLGPTSVSDGSGKMVAHLFRIPFPSVAPAGVWDAPPDVGEIREHFASAKVPTETIAPGAGWSSTGVFDAASDTSGLYQLEVALFDGNGQPVNIAVLGIVFAVPQNPDASGTVATTDAATLGLVAGNTMVITLHVDNNPCLAAVAAPTLGLATADACCGVLHYADTLATVTLGWTAEHPHGFATYRFDVTRGVNGVASATGPVVPGGSPITPTVKTLMDTNLPAGCAAGGCMVAGFAETLAVYATATDGWSRQSQHDRPATRAFVLSNT